MYQNEIKCPQNENLFPCFNNSPGQYIVLTNIYEAIALFVHFKWAAYFGVCTEIFVCDGWTGYQLFFLLPVWSGQVHSGMNEREKGQG